MVTLTDIAAQKVQEFMSGQGAEGDVGLRVGVKYAALDILPDPRIREELSAVSGWPTIPQLFVDGELVGGSDIVMEMFESGELAETLGVDQPDLSEASPGEPEPSASEQPPQRQTGIGLENRLS